MRGRIGFGKHCGYAASMPIDETTRGLLDTGCERQSPNLLQRQLRFDIRIRSRIVVE